MKDNNWRGLRQEWMGKGMADNPDDFWYSLVNEDLDKTDAYRHFRRGGVSSPGDHRLMAVLVHVCIDVFPVVGLL
jgi:hypothetical protein